jgi:hypothetical protein
MALAFILLLFLPCHAQNLSPPTPSIISANPAASLPSVSLSTVSPCSAPASPSDEHLELLIRKYTSPGTLENVGQVKLVWLHPELLRALLEQDAKERNLSPAQLSIAERQMNARLELPNTISFLMIIEPEKNSYISRPDWVIDAVRQYPSVILKGAHGRIGVPIKWDKQLDNGLISWFAGPMFGYITFNTSTLDGKPLFDNDYSFAIETTSLALVRNRVYYLSQEFNYSLMPVDLAHLVDKSLPWNPGRLQTRERVEEVTVNHERQYAQGALIAASQESSTELTRPELWQIIGDAIGFVALFVK